MKRAYIPPNNIIRGRCGREFTTLCNRPGGHKGLCSWENQSDIPMASRATGRSIPDLTKREHVCEYQSPIKPGLGWVGRRRVGGRIAAKVSMSAEGPSQALSLAWHTYMEGTDRPMYGPEWELFDAGWDAALRIAGVRWACNACNRPVSMQEIAADKEVCKCGGDFIQTLFDPTDTVCQGCQTNGQEPHTCPIYGFPCVIDSSDE